MEKIDEKEKNIDEVKVNSIEESKETNTYDRIVFLKNKAEKNSNKNYKIVIKNRELPIELLIIKDSKTKFEKNRDIREISPNRYVEYFKTKHGIGFRFLTNEEIYFYKRNNEKDIDIGKNGVLVLKKKRRK